MSNSSRTATLLRLIAWARTMHLISERTPSPVARRAGFSVVPCQARAHHSGMHASIPPTPSLPASKASRRDADRARKRIARQALREAGAPDPRQLDAAIVDALRDVLVACATSVGTRPGEPLVASVVDAREVLRLALRGLRGRENGGVPLQTEAIRAALVARLAPPPDGSGA